MRKKIVWKRGNLRLKEMKAKKKRERKRDKDSRGWGCREAAAENKSADSGVQN